MLVAETDANGKTSFVRRRETDSPEALAWSAARFADHGGKPLVLEEAHREGLFREDPCVQSAHVRSLMCIPVSAEGGSRAATGESVHGLSLRAGLLHLVSGLRAAQVGTLLGLSRWVAQVHIHEYREALRRDDELARGSAAIVEQGLREAYGGLAHLATRRDVPTAPTWV